MEPLAVIPYSKNKTIDFYEDRFNFKNNEILYESVNGYSYSITHTTGSIYFIPLANSTRLNLSIDDGTKKLKTFSKEIASGFIYKGKGQLTVETIFSELVHCLNTFIAPIVYKKLVEEIVEYGSANIGNITIQKDSLSTKGLFKEKELSYADYGETIINQGVVYVKSKNGKVFYSCALGVMNAPLLPVLIDTMKNWDDK